VPVEFSNANPAGLMKLVWQPAPHALVWASTAWRLVLVSSSGGSAVAFAEGGGS
jgi:hypothetical protein